MITSLYRLRSASSTKLSFTTCTAPQSTTLTTSAGKAALSRPMACSRWENAHRTSAS